jgi:nucleoporin POM34
MASLVKLGSAPATPRSQIVGTPASNSPTGAWRHPRLSEITKRQQASTFNDRNVSIVLWNLLLLLITFVLVRIARTRLSPETLNYLAALAVYPTLIRWFIRSVFLVNIAIAVWPLVRRKDDLSDIPLTPSQRKLLGLGPSSTPATPDSQYSTPPRYPRSATPQSSEGRRRGSPFSSMERGSPTGPSGSPFSPTASPLVQKAIGSGVTRRHSNGSLATVASHHSIQDLGWPNLPTTPTPMSGKNPSVGLNSKWLYERSRTSLGGRGTLS